MKDRRITRANKKKAKEEKEERLTPRNEHNVLDLTPYNAVLLIRGEKEKLRWK